MGLTEINGLPAHVLIVHFVVVGVPLAAALLLASALWPAARRRLGATTPVVALLALASVPLASHAGEWLQERVGRDPLVQRHAQLGDTLLPWAAGLFAVAAAVWALDRVTSRRRLPVGAGGPGPDPEPVGSPLTGTAARIALAVLALVVAVGSVVQVYRIGDSGSKAAWHDKVSAATTPGDGD